MAIETNSSTSPPVAGNVSGQSDPRPEADVRINIVEDNVIVAEDIRVSLEHQGYRVTAINTNYADAIEQARTHRPHLVLMDIYLERGDSGVEAAEEIRRELDIPVVFLTAYSDQQTVDSVKRTDPYGYLIKPFEARELRTTIEMALHRFRLEGQLREREAWLSTTLNSIGDGIIATVTDRLEPGRRARSPDRRSLRHQTGRHRRTGAFPRPPGPGRAPGGLPGTQHPAHPPQRHELPDRR